MVPSAQADCPVVVVPPDARPGRSSLRMLDPCPCRAAPLICTLAGMTSPLDILVIESHPGAGAQAARQLEAAGHHVVRCHDSDSRGFPCRGVVDPQECPLSAVPDVALLVRSRVDPRPTPLEHGVSCALRAGVPLVEAGPATLDPYEPWLATRVERAADIVATCETVAAAVGRTLRADVLRRIETIVRGIGARPGAVDCRLEQRGGGLRVHLDLPVVVGPGVEQAIAVRVLDAVRAGDRTVGSVDVSVHGPR